MNNFSGEHEVPLLADRGGDGWWRKVVDTAEVKLQVVLAVPLVLTNVFCFLIPLVSVMFAGHLGQLQLAGSTLAHSWATVTGFAFMLGLSGALQTLCGQGFGAKLYQMLGIYLQASCMISLFFALIISILWWYTQHILIFLHQDPEISREAAMYMRCLIPGIFAFGVLQNILRFLQSQCVVKPLVVCSLLPLLLHIGLNYVLVRCTSLGYRGAPLATSITFWLVVIMLVIYVRNAKELKLTWTGFSLESFRYVFVNLKLALYSATMYCLEDWAFEILVLLSGLTPNSQTTVSVIALCANTETTAYNLTYGLSSAASTRVSNELGAGRVNQAKHAMGVTLKMSILLGVFILVTLGLWHDAWAGFFSDSTNIIQAFSSMTPLLCVSLFADSIQGVLSGTAIGCGWQHVAMYLNMGTFYLIGMPIGCLLAFKFELYAKGLWMGLICGLITQTLSLFVLTRFRKWTTHDLCSSDKENLPLVC